MLAGVFVEVGEVFTAELAVAAQVEIGAVGYAFQFAPAPGEQILDVGSGLGVVRQLFLLVGAQAQALRPDAVPGIPVIASIYPLLMPLLVGAGAHKVLHLHLLELAHAEDEVTGGDFIAERLALLGYAEGQFAAHGLLHVQEVDEYALRGLRAQIGYRGLIFHRADEGLEHQVEAAHLGQLASALRTATILDLIGPEAALALFAVHQRVGELGDVARSLPHHGRHEYSRIEAHDVVAQLHHVAPPQVFDVAFELHPQRPIVIGRAEAPVYFAGREDKAPALAQRNNCIHRNLSRRPDRIHGGISFRLLSILITLFHSNRQYRSTETERRRAVTPGPTSFNPVFCSILCVFRTLCTCVVWLHRGSQTKMPRIPAVSIGTRGIALLPRFHPI